MRGTLIPVRYKRLFGAPPWSLDRLRIDYRGDGGVSFVLISPEDKLRFMRELAGRRAGLEVRGERVVRIS